jgi:hypothetical protein
VAGAVYRDRVAAADDEDALTFSVVEGPPGLSIDAASGLLFWQSAVTDAGPFVPADADTYIGDLIDLQMSVGPTATQHECPDEGLVLAADEV